MRQARIERVKILSEGKAPAQKEELERSLLDFEDYKFKVDDKFEFYFRKSDSV